MSEKRPDDQENLNPALKCAFKSLFKSVLKLGGEKRDKDEDKEKLAIDFSERGPAAQPQTEERNEDGRKKEVALDLSASGSTAKPLREERNEGKKKKKVTFDLSANRSTAVPRREKTNGDNEKKKKVMLDRSATGSADKAQWEKGKEAVDEGLQKTTGMEDRYSSSKSISIGGETPILDDVVPKSYGRKLLYRKTLTPVDLHSGHLKNPRESSQILLPKWTTGKNDRIMVPFKDNKGQLWRLEMTFDGLSYNWDKFVQAHGLKCGDIMYFYDDDPTCMYYIIDYRKVGGDASDASTASRAAYASSS